MKRENFTAAFLVDQSPREAFEAINNVRAWWSETVKGATDKAGESFEYEHKPYHRSVQKVTELVPGRKVAWRVLESEIHFVKDKAEWKGTDIVFEIGAKGGKTEVRMTHVGLVPALECFSDCSKGWGYYFSESLRKLITTGTGGPDRKR